MSSLRKGYNILGEKKTRKEMRHVLTGLALVVAGGIMIGLNA